MKAALLLQRFTRSRLRTARWIRREANRPSESTTMLKFKRLARQVVASYRRQRMHVVVPLAGATLADDERLGFAGWLSLLWSVVRDFAAALVLSIGIAFFMLLQAATPATTVHDLAAAMSAQTFWSIAVCLAILLCAARAIVGIAVDQLHQRIVKAN